MMALNDNGGGGGGGDDDDNNERLSSCDSGDESSSGGTSSKQNSRKRDDDDDDGEKEHRTTWITVETQDGKLEQLKVHLDDANFATSDHLMRYLVENGELVATTTTKTTGGAVGGSTSIAADHRRRGSFFFRSKQQGNKHLVHPDVEGQLVKSLARDNSIITPGLINDLKKNRKRIVAKGGQCNIQLRNVKKKKQQFLKDLFTTAVDMEWRYTLLAFTSSFFVSWLVFAVLYYVVALYRGDLEERNLPGGEAQINGTWKPCVLAIEDFTSCYLFSLETQHTIGYGSRQTTEKCPEAVILMSIQSILGVVISSCMAGIVFAKLARPKNRSNTIMFSKNAVVTMRNGELFLLLKVGNMRRSHLIEAHVRAILVHHKRCTREGELVTYDTQELMVSTEMDVSKRNDVDEDEDDVQDERNEDRAFLMWPNTVAHKIDAGSPFYALSPKQLLASKFEMIVTLEGIVEPTGNSVQARTSYLPNEILWGHRFHNVMSYKKKRGIYQVDFSYLNSVVQDDTPRISAKCAVQNRRRHAKPSFATSTTTMRKISSNLNVNKANQSGSDRSSVVGRKETVAISLDDLNHSSNVGGRPSIAIREADNSYNPDKTISGSVQAL